MTAQQASWHVGRLNLHRAAAAAAVALATTTGTATAVAKLIVMILFIISIITSIVIRNSYVAGYHLPFQFCRPRQP